MSKNVVSASDVAKFFLVYASKDEEAELITNLKLQKLVYYAQGFHLALFDKVLFNEKILAWRHGPVVREVYDEFKEYKDQPIKFSNAFNEVMEKFFDEQKDFLSEVYQVYGQYTAWRLRDMTHEESPWIEASRKVKEPQENIEITPEALTSFFKTRVATNALSD